jgi:hypothetical protein
MEDLRSSEFEAAKQRFKAFVEDHSKECGPSKPLSLIQEGNYSLVSQNTLIPANSVKIELFSDAGADEEDYRGDGLAYSIGVVDSDVSRYELACFGEDFHEGNESEGYRSGVSPAVALAFLDKLEEIEQAGLLIPATQE